MAQHGNSPTAENTMELDSIELDYHVMDVSGCVSHGGHAPFHSHHAGGNTPFIPSLPHLAQRPHDHHQHSFYRHYDEDDEITPTARVPERTASERSQTRRFAAGHAEMQRSAFLSSQNDQDGNSPKQEPKKIKAEVAAAMDSSPTFAESQPQKRPRRLVQDQRDPA